MGYDPFGSMYLWTTIIAVVGVLVTVAIAIGLAVFIRKATMGGGQLVIAVPGQMGLLQPPTPQGGAQQIKKAVCRNCGASKQRPSRTAYLYCDYCGTLVDWDFRVSITTAASAMPGPEYERLRAQVAPVQARAKVARDRETYRQTLAQLFDMHMRACPASYSPRLGDPAYRAAILDYTVATYLDAAFDPEAQARQAAMDGAVRGLRWSGGFGTPRRVERQSFQALVASFKAFLERSSQLSEPHLDRHPDQPTRAIIDGIASSAFVQGWLPYLAEPDQEALIREMGLGGEYVPLTPVDTTDRHCGSCGQPSPVVARAERVVCESCGHTIDVSRPEIQCTSCGAPLSIPIGATRHACPHCRADLRMDGAL
ncbi:MAG: hypothetical protein HYY06_03660 [Deltaproteobacteria bacterium]|nr:hypothetical protein [Deltaproteobacteria bacterium]